MNQIYQGLDEIAAVFNISPRTAQRWINEHGLPAFKRPNGTWVLTNSLIDSWGHWRAVRSIGSSTGSKSNALLSVLIWGEVWLLY